MDLGCFDDKVEADGHRLYRATFFDKIKADGAAKSRLCVAACSDNEHDPMTGAPTVKRLTIRLLIAIGVSYGLKLFTRDVAKAFVQSHTTLRRAVYMRAPKEIQLPPGKV